MSNPKDHSVQASTKSDPILNVVFRAAKRWMSKDGKREMRYNAYVPLLSVSGLAVVCQVFSQLDGGAVTGWTVSLPSNYRSATIEAMPHVIEHEGTHFVTDAPEACAEKVVSIEKAIHTALMAFQHSNFSKPVQPLSLSGI